MVYIVITQTTRKGKVLDFFLELFTVEVKY